jgi:hypothetical protein
MSVLDKLTEGIVNRDLQKEGAALLNKWENTGLLEGLNSDQTKDAMARLLENQAKELLRESTTMSGGDVEGFAAVAFPIVRRVFGNLIANDLVSVQPMSLPSGLIFFLDFTVSAESNGAVAAGRLGYVTGSSLYGGGVVAKGLQDGVSLTGDNASAGPYNLNNGYSSPTASAALVTAPAAAALTITGTGSAGDEALDKAIRYDPDLSGSGIVVAAFSGSSVFSQLDVNNLVAITLSGSFRDAGLGVQRGKGFLPYDADGTIKGARLIRRLTELHSGSSGNDPTSTNHIVKFVFEAASNLEVDDLALAIGDTLAPNGDQTHGREHYPWEFPITDDFVEGGAIGSVVGDPTWELEAQAQIPEIDIKVDSVAVTAKTKKLKAKWTPELGQDLSAYHNLDAEVELTSILSEQIALEIDREILEDLIKGATAGTQYWSRRPGRFLARDNGEQIGGNLDNESLMGADFTGTVSEWYETLAETINDVSAQIHRKTLRGGANFVVCGPEVANILEFTAGFRASIGNDYGNGSVGAVNVGSLSKKFDVYVDPYFPRNVILVGRKGGSFLESGYVYAPYVPLQVTPTIFGTEDFVPRKGVMTRYAKEMVRPDMYGLVICRDLNG